jgi:hypothetical protein
MRVGPFRGVVEPVAELVDVEAEELHGAGP